MIIKLSSRHVKPIVLRSFILVKSARVQDSLSVLSLDQVGYHGGLLLIRWPWLHLLTCSLLFGGLKGMFDVRG